MKTSARLRYLQLNAFYNMFDDEKELKKKQRQTQGANSRIRVNFSFGTHQPLMASIPRSFLLNQLTNNTWTPAQAMKRGTKNLNFDLH
jgi:hypothetical protein